MVDTEIEGMDLDDWITTLITDCIANLSIKVKRYVVIIIVVYFVEEYTGVILTFEIKENYPPISYLKNCV